METINRGEPRLGFFLTLIFGPFGFMYVSPMLGLVMALCYLGVYFTPLGLSLAMIVVLNAVLAVIAYFWLWTFNKRLHKRMANLGQPSFDATPEQAASQTPSEEEREEIHAARKEKVPG